MNKIYLYCYPAGDAWSPSDVIGGALAEDGTLLAGHLSSNVEFSKHDMGLTSTWKHDLYTQHYPSGYELEWVDDLEGHAGFNQAVALNKGLSA